jgi:hypothetical protein
MTNGFHHGEPSTKHIQLIARARYLHLPRSAPRPPRAAHITTIEDSRRGVCCTRPLEHLVRDHVGSINHDLTQLLITLDSFFDSLYGRLVSRLADPGKLQDFVNACEDLHCAYDGLATWTPTLTQGHNGALESLVRVLGCSSARLMVVRSTEHTKLALVKLRGMFDT